MSETIEKAETSEKTETSETAIDEKAAVTALVRHRLAVAAQNEKLGMREINTLRRFLAAASKMVGHCKGPQLAPGAQADAQLQAPAEMGYGIMGGEDYDLDGSMLALNPGGPNNETFAATLLRELTAGAGGLRKIFQAQVAAKLADSELSARKAGNTAMADKLAGLFEDVTAVKKPEVKDAKASGDTSGVPTALPELPPA